MNGPRVSYDPGSGTKIHDITEIYVNPPDHAPVISVDGKRRRQALVGARKPLPTKKDGGDPQRDHKWNGTACLEGGGAGGESRMSRFGA